MEAWASAVTPAGVDRVMAKKTAHFSTGALGRLGGTRGTQEGRTKNIIRQEYRLSQRPAMFALERTVAALAWPAFCWSESAIA
jgi:hypothetical protein